jgi:hypothetical protein
VRQRHRRLDRHRNPESAEHLVIEAAMRIGPAKDDHDVVRPKPLGEQARDLAADRLGLAALAAALHEREPAVRFDARLADLEQAAIQIAKRGAGRIARIERKLLDAVRRQLVPQLRQELGARCEGIVVLVVDRDRHLGRRAEGAHQVELLLGQVVEPVDEHRT